MITTEIIKISKDRPEVDKIDKAVEKLRKGAIIAFPTETVYGLGANGNDLKAIGRLHEVKNRPKDKPFTFFVSQINEVEEYALDILPAAYRLVDKFWPGPLTIVLKSKNTATIGLRMPKCSIAYKLAQAADFPIAAPSANVSEQKPALDANDVLKEFKGKIDLVIDGGKTELGQSSTVVDVRDIPFKILRKGNIDGKLIEDASKKKRILFVCTGNSCRSVMAQWLLEKKIKEKKRNDLEVDSAGIGSLEGMSASNETAMLLKDEGIDVSEHQAKRLNNDILRRSDLILVMQRFQENDILDRVPSLKGRVYLLEEFSRFRQDNLEITDPMGRGLDVYRQVFSTIKEAVDRIIDLI